MTTPAEGAAWDVPLKGERQGRGPAETSAALRDWLAPRLPGAHDLRLTELVRPQGNGVSNETVLFEAAWSGGHRRLVARLQTDDPLYLDASIERQYRMYEALAGVPGAPVPDVVGYEPDAAVLGTPFFVMSRVEGRVPSDNPHWTRQGWVVDATPEQRARLWRSAVERLVALHAVDPGRVAFLQQPGRGRSGLEQDLTYWRSSYRWAARGEVHPVMEAGEAWLLEHLPDAPEGGLSWGDCRPENMVFADDFQCAGLLDFETASLAGPAVDLAWWSLMDKGSARLPGLGSPRETVELYRELSGNPLRELRYGLVLCAFRLAAVYLRLAAQLDARGVLSEDKRDLGRNSEKMQQLALLLGVEPPGPLSASLPDLDA